MKRKLLSILLALSLALSLLPMSVLAAEGDKVAKIGTTEYAALAEAFAAAKSGDTIKIIKAGEYDIPSKFENINIEGAAGDGAVVAIIKDGLQYGQSAGALNNVTFKNLSFSFSGNLYTGFQHSEKITFENCNFTGRFNSYGTMQFVNCHFTSPSGDYAMWLYAGDVTFTGCAFDSDGKIFNVYNEGNDGGTPWNVTATGCTFNSTKTNKAAFNVKETCGDKALRYNVSISNCTCNENFPAASESDSLIVFNGLVQVDDRKTGKDGITVTLDGTTVYENGKKVSTNFFEKEGVWHIANEAGWIEFAAAVNAGTTFEGKTVVLDKDLDMSSYAKVDPVGDFNGKPFKGTFDGNDETIRNINIYRFYNGANNSTGVFGKVYAPAVIKDLTVADATVTADRNAAGDKAGAYVGGIVGHGYADISNCSFSGTVYGGHQVGGIAGSGGFTISECSFDGDIVSNRYWALGGIIGNCQDGGEISDNTAKGTITATYDGESGKYMGGIVGCPLYNTQVISGNNSQISLTYNGAKVNQPIVGAYNDDDNKNMVDDFSAVSNNTWDKTIYGSDSYPVTRDIAGETDWFIHYNGATEKKIPTVDVGGGEPTTVTIGETSEVIVEEAAPEAVKTIAEQITTTNTAVSGVKLTTEAVGEDAKSGLQAVVDEAKAAAQQTGQAKEKMAALATATEVKVDVTVQVKPVAYAAPVEAQNTGAIKFELKPVATVTAVSDQGDTLIADGIEVKNEMIDTAKPITVKFYTGFKPAQIIHAGDNGFMETFTEGTGKGTFSYDSTNKTCTLTISHFSTLLAVQETQVAQIVGGDYYPSLAAAIDAATTNDTVNLLKDVTLTKQLEIDKAITLDGAKQDGGTYTITRNPGGADAAHKAGILVTAGATIQNLTVSGPNNTPTDSTQHWDEGEYGIKFYDATNATLNNVTVKNANAGIQVNGGSVTMKNNITVSGNEFGGIELCHGGVLNLSEATLVCEDEADAKPVLWNDDFKGTITQSTTQPLYVKKIDDGKDHYYLSGTAEASLNGQKYLTLTDAVAAATTDDTVTLLKNVALTKQLEINKAITLDGGNNTITRTPGGDNASKKGGILVTAAATIQNLTVSGPNTNPGWNEGEYGIKVYNTTGVTLENVTVTAANAGILVDSSEVTLKGAVNVSGNEFGGIEVSKGKNLEKAGVLTIANETTVTCTDANVPAIWIDGTTAEAGTVTNNSSTVLYKDTTTKKNAQIYFWTSGTAKINNDCYRGLADAVAAAQSEQTVTLLQNVTLASRVDVNANGNTITIDLGGKTITTSETCANGSAFNVVSGNVTIWNGSINGVEETGKECDAITVRSGATATLKDLNVTIKSKNGACAYAFEGGHINIESGTYTNNTTETYQYNSSFKAMLVNQANVATPLVTITGGTFVGQNPASGDDAGQVTTFLANGYKAVSQGNAWVVVLSTQEVVIPAADPKTVFGESSGLDETEQTEIIEALTGNDAVANNDATNVDKVNGVETLEIALKTVAATSSGTVAVTKITYNVTPKAANGAEVKNPATPISFRLPVTDDFEGYAKVTHKGEPVEVSYAEVKVGDTGAKYVELTFSHFSVVELENTKTPSHTHNEEITFEPIASEYDLRTLFTDGRNGYLVDNIKLETNEALTVGADKTVNLCLNGKVLNLNGKGNITVGAGTTLNLYDCNTETKHRFGDTDGLWTWNDDLEDNKTEHTVTGGVITGGIGTTIVANEKSKKHGGGVYVEGTLDMKGGNIVGNKVEKLDQDGVGGGVYNKGRFAMSGGTISGNTAYDGNGGGVVSTTDNGSFTMTNGTISENKAANFGGVQVPAGSFTMTGGSIDNNKATVNYAGVVVGTGTITLGGTAKITGNTLSDNTASNLYLLTNRIVTLGTKTGDSEGQIGNGVAEPVAPNATDPTAPYMSVGVTMQKPGVFTGENEKDYSALFTPDAGADNRVIDLESDSKHTLKLVMKYAVNVADDIQNGTVTTNVTDNKAFEGDTVTITVTPDSGYQLKANSLLVKYNDGAEKTITPQATQTAGEYTFTMPAYAVTVTAEFEEVPHTHSFTYSVGEGTAANVLTATCADSDGKCQLTNKKVALTLTKNATADYYVYNNSAKTIDFASGEAAAWKTATGSDAPTITYTAKTGSDLTEGKAVKAGSYTATVTVTVDTNKSATLDFTIAKATQTAAVSISGYTYAGTVSTPSLTGASETPTATYYYNMTDSTTGGTEWKDITATSLDAGTYYMYAVVDATDNYAQQTTAAVAFTIAKADQPAVTVSMSGYTYGSDPAIPALSSAAKDGAAITYYYSTSNATTGGTEWKDMTATKLNAGTYYMYAEIAATDNYNAYTTATTAFTVEKKTVTVTANDKTLYVGDLFNDEVLLEIGVTIEGLVGDDELTTYGLSCEVPFNDAFKLTTAGTYAIVVTVEPDAAGGNYNVVAGEDGTLTVNKKSTGGGGGSSSYAVTVESAKNGTVSTDKKNASAGSTVTITVVPDKGFTLETLTVLDKNGKEIEVKNLGNNKFSFKMPSGKVTVEATFMEDNTMLNFFVDVPATEYYYDAVLWAAENSITTGVDAVHFGPEAPVTRGQVVTFLWRAAGCPEPKGDADKFTDLLADQYYLKAVAWAIEQGITKGVTDTTFEPETVCTRGQIVTFLARFAGVEDTETESVFADVPASEFFAAAVKWAKDNGVTSGVTETAFEPYTNCNRAQVVTFLYRWMVK